MEFYAFGFFISVICFGAMFFLFYQVVIGPMEDAVAIRARRIQSRLDEIRLTLSQAQKLEAEVQAQFARLDAEKQEMRESADREIARNQDSLREAAERDAVHMVDKAGREAEKNRQEALAAVNKQITEQAMSQVETLLSRALDAQAQQASVSQVLGKVVNRAS